MKDQLRDANEQYVEAGIELTKIKIEVEAIETGYYGAEGQPHRIIPSGKRFIYDGILKDGRLPAWVQAVGEMPSPKKKTAKVKKEKVDDVV